MFCILALFFHWKSFLKRKINKQKIVLIASFTILLMCTPSTHLWRVYLHALILISFIHDHLWVFLSMIICENLFLSLRISSYLHASIFACENHFLSIIINENFFLSTITWIIFGYNKINTFLEYFAITAKISPKHKVRISILLQETF